MKLASRGKGSKKVELNMTSMIDCIFLLLIFFMVNASMGSNERNLDSAIEAQSKGGKKASFEPVIIDFVNSPGGTFYKVGTRQIRSFDELVSVLQQFPNKRDGAFVRVTNDIPFTMAAQAIQAARDAGFASVSYIPATQ